MNIGLLHPGEMGISVAASLQLGGQKVYWLGEGRSKHSHERAAKQRLIDSGSLEAFCRTCDVVFSICPPHAAEQVAEAVLEQGYQGLYVDANAISPQRAVNMGDMLTKGGVDFVDGGIIGPPAWRPGTTWLHLSGQNAPHLLELFESGPINTCIVGDNPGRASALKMCFAAYTKGRTALLMAILALADHHDITQALEDQWTEYWPDFVEQTHDTIGSAIPKAWRFSGEMAEIATTFSAAGLPEGFHQAARAIYTSLEDCKDASELPDVEQLLTILRS